MLTIPEARMKLLYLIYKLWIGLVFWLTLILLYPLFFILLSGKKGFPLAFKLKKIWSLLIRTLIFCPIKIEKIADFPKPPYVVVSNHASYLDTPFMFAVVPDYFLFLGKGELLKWPLFRIFFRKMDIPVQRNSIKESLKAYQKASDALKKGECIAIYPEATIHYPVPTLGRFKGGAFRLAAENNVPIVPVIWKNNYKVLNEVENLWSKSQPQKIQVVVEKAIYPDASKPNPEQKMKSELRSVFESHLRNVYRK